MSISSARQIDLQRFPSAGVVLDWMIAAGFDAIHWGVVEHIQHPLTGREVLNDPFLQKNGTSQLVLLTDEEYAIGLERIRTAVDQAATCGQEIIFPVDLSLTMLVGRRRDHPG